jgi:hypothetical protein
LQDETWGNEFDHELVDVERAIKEAVRLVMKFDERYHEMISEMEIPDSLKRQLMREVKAKRKRSEWEQFTDIRW